MIIFYVLFSGSQNNLHCSCNGGATTNGNATGACSGVLARKIQNHTGASPGQVNKRPAVALTHLPKRPPVDIDFKNLAYSVSEGRKRGELSLTIAIIKFSRSNNLKLPR